MGTAATQLLGAGTMVTVPTLTAMAGAPRGLSLGACPRGRCHAASWGGPGGHTIGGTLACGGHADPLEPAGAVASGGRPMREASPQSEPQGTTHGRRNLT